MIGFRSVAQHRAWLGVRVLLAVESGSRAWGFASPDSDYDVRFIYVNSRDWYLSILEERDVIEQMLPGDLDVSGWDLRKTLRLFAKCNLALNEWLGSPLTYVQEAEFARSSAHSFLSISIQLRPRDHYRKMADAAFDGHFADGQIGIKKIFYVLRPLLACRWIEHARSQPPTEFAELVTPISSRRGARMDSRSPGGKASAPEAERIRIDDDRAKLIRTELARYAAVAATLPAPGVRRWTISIQYCGTGSRLDSSLDVKASPHSAPHDLRALLVGLRIEPAPRGTGGFCLEFERHFRARKHKAPFGPAGGGFFVLGG